jgi:hypothetical protein
MQPTVTAFERKGNCFLRISFDLMVSPENGRFKSILLNGLPINFVDLAYSAGFAAAVLRLKPGRRTTLLAGKFVI